MGRWGDGEMGRRGDEEDKNKDIGTYRKSFPPCSLPPAPCPPASSPLPLPQSLHPKSHSSLAIPQLLDVPAEFPMVVLDEHR
jgi:hypothetical protein